MLYPIVKSTFPILVVCGLIAAQAEAAVYTLKPIEDTYVDFYNGDTNFGNSPGLVTNFAFLSPRAFTYLKFDLSVIPPDEIITGATLNLFQQGVGGVGGGGPVDVSHYSDSWSESTITWNNAPAIPGPKLADNNVQTTGWVNWNLFETGLWDPAADLSNDLLSLVLGEGNSADSAHGFCSRESDPLLDNCLVAGETDVSDDREPYLILQTTPIDLPKTGQTTCYNAAGDPVSCAGTGQDGEYQAGIAWPSPRFTVNSNGTVTDHLTGLMWMKDASCFSNQSWQGALDRTAELNAGTSAFTCQDYTDTYADWRVPNIVELESLAHGGYNEEDCGGSPCVELDQWLASLGFVGILATTTNYYWSSTTSDVQVNKYAWRMLMRNGTLDPYIKSTQQGVWPVRTSTTGIVDLPQTGQTACYNSMGDTIVCAGTGQDGEVQAGIAWPSPRFNVNGDGTVTDALTGLIWLEDANCIKSQYPAFDADATAGDGKVLWQHALDFVAGVNLGTYPNCGAGQTNWRLPNRKEYLSLVDYSAHYGSALTPGNPFGTTVEWNEYWSSTTFSGDTSFGTNLAWYVVFDEGGSYRNIKGSFGFVWLVRDTGDTDGDGIADGEGSNPCSGGNTIDCDDNCVATYNPDQADGDGDGVGDVCDNCTLVANTGQRDTDGDNIGNQCDCDFNQDNFCGGPDFTQFIGCFNAPTGGDSLCEATDMNSDDFVGGPDFTLFIGGFNGPPGPSGLAP